MGHRGRKTAAQKVVQLRALQEMGLPEPPAHLGKAEQQEWIDIVETYPPDRFPRSTWPMLEGYCSHTIQMRRISGMIGQMTNETSIREYNTLLVMLDRETKAVASFGVRLGIARTSMGGRHNSDPDKFADNDLPWKADQA
jgi:hypothetical protein